MTLRYRVIPVTPFAQNCSLVYCSRSKKAAFVDPGGDLDQLLDAAEAEGVEVEKIIVTHGHIDHVGGVAELAADLSVPIEGPHRDDAFWIEGLPMQASMFGFPGAKSFTPDRWLDDGDTVTVGDQTLEVRLCPGHTPGHVVLFHRPSKTAWVGDVLFRGSIGRTDFPKGDHPTLLRSIKTKLWPLGDDVTFVPGHGPTSTFGRERRDNPFVRD